jgi:hypothetical protein
MNDRSRLVTEAAREVSEDWTADGRMHLPPDDIRDDDDVGFSDEVERRVAQRLEQATNPSS